MVKAYTQPPQTLYTFTTPALAEQWGNINDIAGKVANTQLADLLDAGSAVRGFTL